MLNRRFYQSISLAFIASTAFSLPIIAAAEMTPQIQEEAVQRFSDTISLIDNYYVSSTTSHTLFDNAIEGMLNGLDPHSSVLNKDFLTEQAQSIINNPADVGLELTLDQGALKVITPLLDTPAFKAGILPGDYIIKIGSKSSQGLSFEEAMQLMRGKEGTSIDLVILRKGELKTLLFKLVREKAPIDSVKSQLVDNHYAYIRISQFRQNTGKDMSNAINMLLKQTDGKLKGLVLDLRFNPGGLLPSGVEAADAFIDNSAMNNKKIIAHTKGRIPNLKYTALATPGDILNGAPIVVLINNGSASAAEVVAAALQDNRRAVIVGTKSFGKGSVQTVLPLDDKLSMKLTTALYYTPAGALIQDVGITPDITVEAQVLLKPNQTDSTSNLNEADLKNHLITNKESVTRTQNNDIQETQALLHKDYQLYTAFIILKGSSVTH